MKSTLLVQCPSKPRRTAEVSKYFGAVFHDFVSGKKLLLKVYYQTIELFLFICDKLRTIFLFDKHTSFHQSSVSIEDGFFGPQVDDEPHYLLA